MSHINVITIKRRFLFADLFDNRLHRSKTCLTALIFQCSQLTLMGIDFGPSSEVRNKEMVCVILVDMDRSKNNHFTKGNKKI